MGDRLATVGMGRKVEGAAVPLFVEGAGSPSNTMSPGPMPTSVPSGALDPSNGFAAIHQRYRETGQDNGPVA